MSPTNLAFAFLELFPQFPQPLGIFEDIGDALLMLRVRLAARLGLLGFGRFNTAVLDAIVQLVDGQVRAGPPGGNGVEIGAVGVLVRKDGPTGRLLTPGLLPPFRPTGDLREVYVQAFGFAQEGLAGLHVTLRRGQVVVDGRARGGLSPVVIEQSIKLFLVRRGEFRMVREVLHAADQFVHAADQFVVPAHEGERQAGPVGDGDQFVPVDLQPVVERSANRVRRGGGVLGRSARSAVLPRAASTGGSAARATAWAATGSPDRTCSCLVSCRAA